MNHENILLLPVFILRVFPILQAREEDIVDIIPFQVWIGDKSLKYLILVCIYTPGIRIL